MSVWSTTGHHASALFAPVPPDGHRAVLAIVGPLGWTAWSAHDGRVIGSGTEAGRAGELAAEAALATDAPPARPSAEELIASIRRTVDELSRTYGPDDPRPPSLAPLTAAVAALQEEIDR